MIAKTTFVSLKHKNLDSGIVPDNIWTLPMSVSDIDNISLKIKPHCTGHYCTKVTIIFCKIQCLLKKRKSSDKCNWLSSCIFYPLHTFGFFISTYLHIVLCYSVFHWLDLRISSWKSRYKDGPSNWNYGPQFEITVRTVNFKMLPF